MGNLQELWIFYFIVKVMIDISVKDVREIKQHSKTFILRRFFEAAFYFPSARSKTSDFSRIAFSTLKTKGFADTRVEVKPMVNTRQVVILYMR
ncbi:hypothetical protein ACT7DZ_38210 [Bacillus cereus]